MLGRCLRLICGRAGLIALILLVCVVSMVGCSSEKDKTAKKPVTQVAQEETKPVAPANVRDEIVAEIYVPTQLDKRATAPFYVVLKNKSDKVYDGSFELEGVETEKASDKVGNLKLYPAETRIIAGVGNVPSDTSTIKVKATGSFEKGKKYSRNGELDYSIVKTEQRGVMTILYVYMPKGLSDDTYIACAKEIKSNMSHLNKIVVADIGPIAIDPAFEEVWIRMRTNKIIKKDDILFYTDETNDHIWNPQEYSERRILEF